MDHADVFGGPDIRDGMIEHDMPFLGVSRATSGQDDGVTHGCVPVLGTGSGGGGHRR